MANPTNCTRKEHIPTTPHYAILYFSSITIPGDERSRTNPGHGYPEHSQEYINYDAYTDRSTWEAEVQRLTKANRESFVAIEVHPAKIKTEVVVE